MIDWGLNGKVAIVTGSSRGIGKEIALTYALAGAKVVVSSRKQESVEEVAREIAQAGGEALPIATHMGSKDQVEELVARTIQEWGRVDIAVNNAATNPHFGPILTADEGQLDKILDVNLKGCFRLCKSVAPHMQEQRSGKIINVASIAGLEPGTFMGAYSVSKAGVIMLTKVLARELGEFNIQVNAIAPGVIRTKFSRPLWESESLLEEVVASAPLGRIGEVEDVVGSALYLASSASDWVTGTVMVVDGGTMLGPGL